MSIFLKRKSNKPTIFYTKKFFSVIYYYIFITGLETQNLYLEIWKNMEKPEFYNLGKKKPGKNWTEIEKEN